MTGVGRSSVRDSCILGTRSSRLLQQKLVIQLALRIPSGLRLPTTACISRLYGLRWITKDDGDQVLASVVRLVVGTDKEQKAYKESQLSIHEALQESNSHEAMDNVINEAYNQSDCSRKRAIRLACF